MQAGCPGAAPTVLACLAACRYDTREEEDLPETQRLLALLHPFALPLQVGVAWSLNARCSRTGGLALVRSGGRPLTRTCPHMQDMPDRGSVPLLGTTLPLLFPKGSRSTPPEVGSWVKFRNLGARVVGGQLQVGGWVGHAAQVGLGGQMGWRGGGGGDRGAVVAAGLLTLSLSLHHTPFTRALLGLPPPQQPVAGVGGGGGCGSAAPRVPAAPGGEAHGGVGP